MKREDVRIKYESLRDRYTHLLARERRKLSVISWMRLVLFLTGVTISVILFTSDAIAGTAGVVFTLILFLYLVRRYSLSADRIRLYENLVRINVNELKAIDGDFSVFDGGAEYRDRSHDYSEDIDLFGDYSLFSYLNRTVTGHGSRILASWMKGKGPRGDALPEWQEAIRELSLMPEWRQEFMAAGPAGKSDISGMEALFRWLDAPQVVPRIALLKTLSFVCPAAAAIALVLSAASLIPVNFFIMTLLINLMIEGAYLKRINAIHSSVTGRQGYLSLIMELIRTFEGREFSSSLLKSVRNSLCSETGSAAGSIKEFNAIIKSFDTRLNMFAGILLNGLFMWDIRCVIRLSQWREKVKSNLPFWIDQIGRIDGLISLANHAYNNPGYTYPVVSGSGPEFRAEGLGHPLISANRRITNDIVMEKGQIVIITGANMAGKSTFLRSVAVNIVLARTGAPVCAAQMTIRPFNLFTSMRTTDSLSHNESYFYAELQRLRILKDRLENGEEIFFVLDEILKGTNSNDKSLGSRLFLRKLAKLGASGLIATHDTSLGDMDKEFPGTVVNKCFEIDIDGEEIFFDYRLRDGVTHRMNAALLMKQMGIADE